MTPRPTITAAILALNEERNLAGLLPLLDWTDEIVVVDGGSRDATVPLARAHGCRVHHRRLDNFAAQRNHALRLATGDWVLSIDADERPARGLGAEVRRRVAGCPQAAFRVPRRTDCQSVPPVAGCSQAAFRVPRRTDCQSVPRVAGCSQAAFRIAVRSSIFGRRLRRSGTQDDCPIRLVRRGAARWVGDVHEVLRVRGRVGRLDGWLRHDTMPDLHAFLAKTHRYTSLEAHARVAAGQRPSRRDAWIAPPREVIRRLLWKQGLLDGPEGWAFCLLSGLSEWILARGHRRLWQAARQATPPEESSVGWDKRSAGPPEDCVVSQSPPAEPVA